MKKKNWDDTKNIKIVIGGTWLHILFFFVFILLFFSSIIYFFWYSLNYLLLFIQYRYISILIFKSQKIPRISISLNQSGWIYLTWVILLNTNIICYFATYGWITFCPFPYCLPCPHYITYIGFVLNFNLSIKC